MSTADELRERLKYLYATYGRLCLAAETTNREINEVKAMLLATLRQLDAETTTKESSHE
jgi:hypothetical protein